MKRSVIYITFFLYIFLNSNQSVVTAQEYQSTGLNRFLTPADSLYKPRLRLIVAGNAASYAVSFYTLNEYWYKNYEREKFHLFNDQGEWLHMDKIGHVYSTYHHAAYIYDLYQWSGVKSDDAALIGVGTALFFQSAIEIMDGFSAKWGFSIPDVAANIGGAGLFYFQQRLLDRQVVNMKLSSRVIDYDDEVIISNTRNGFSSRKRRADDLFGTSRLEKLLKDYNAQIYWLSFDMNSIIGNGTSWPEWLNLAIGYSGENMYGGYENSWVEDGLVFSLPEEEDRYAQFFFGLDLQVERIHTRSHVLKTLQKSLRTFKIPSPAIEVNTRGEVLFHFFR